MSCFACPPGGERRSTGGHPGFFHGRNLTGPIRTACKMDYGVLFGSAWSFAPHAPIAASRLSPALRRRPALNRGADAASAERVRLAEPRDKLGTNFPALLIPMNTIMSRSECYLSEAEKPASPWPQRLTLPTFGDQGYNHNPFSFLLPEAYSLSSQTTHFPSWATYLVMIATVFCP